MGKVRIKLIFQSHTASERKSLDRNSDSMTSKAKHILFTQAALPAVRVQDLLEKTSDRGFLAAFRWRTLGARSPVVSVTKCSTTQGKSLGLGVRHEFESSFRYLLSITLATSAAEFLQPSIYSSMKGRTTYRSGNLQRLDEGICAKP